MSVDLLELLSWSSVKDDFVNDVAAFRTRTPWIGECAYFHVVYRAADDEMLNELRKDLAVPQDAVEHLRLFNGAKLFSGALAIFGALPRGKLIHRNKPFEVPPFDLVVANQEHQRQPNQLLLAEYRAERSGVYIDLDDFTISLVNDKQAEVVLRWPCFEQWLEAEINRLKKYFSADGRILCGEEHVGPYAALVAKSSIVN